MQYVGLIGGVAVGLAILGIFTVSWVASLRTRKLIASSRGRGAAPR